MAEDGSLTEEAGKAASRRRAASVDTDFLPAALEILERPPSPVGRIIIWLIIAAAALALLWAMFAQVDMVAVSEGRIIPRSRLQSVESSETGIIRAIHVTEGQRVTKGQPLLDLDPTFADADAASARIELETADLARARSEALMQRADGKPVRFVAPANVSTAAANAERTAVTARIAGLDARVGGIDQRVLGARAAIRAAESQLGKLRETQPLLEEQQGILRRLSAEGATTRPQVLDMERRLIENRRDMESKEAEIAQTAAEIETLQRERSQAVEDFRAQVASEMAEAEAIVATRTEGVRKARTREGYQTLLAPVSGTVNDIAVTTLGEVANAGEPIVTIVPDGEELIVEALILNRDVGFIRAGQVAVIKLDAYPFTRHGYLEGQVEQVSPDATVDETRGLVFAGRVIITKNKLRDLGRVSGPDQPALANSADAASKLDLAQATPDRVSVSVLAPVLAGMSVKVEIITGRRTVLDYMLSPIAQATQEAGRER
ncbi:MAG: HlyD family type I secretion periplasmic adaptor subunit [Hyphomonadaceae bacterium]